MEQENKIEELKETIGRIINDAMYHILDEYDSRYLAEELIDKGYSKASDVAAEIFAEIEKEIAAALESNYRAKKERYNHSIVPNYDNFSAMCDGKICAMRGLLYFIAELKNKYTGDEG